MVTCSSPASQSWQAPRRPPSRTIRLFSLSRCRAALLAPAKQLVQIDESADAAGPLPLVVQGVQQPAVQPPGRVGGQERTKGLLEFRVVAGRKLVHDRMLI